MWKFILLETWEFDSLEEINHTLYFGNWEKIESELRQKYPGKELSFQTVSKAHTMKQEFRVYEIIKEKREDEK